MTKKHLCCCWKNLIPWRRSYIDTCNWILLGSPITFE